ncbi:MAG TPA: hypothetical protein VFO27_06200 [Bryobacteraceae bacterium]|nr:hypothetical protein [Bryobacteraceae bacterium]
MVAATEQRNGDGAHSENRESGTGAFGSTAAQQAAGVGAGTSAARFRDTGSKNGREETPLLKEAQTAEFRARWDEIQRGFVDEPRRSVEQADSLVAEAIQELAKVFAEERSRLEQHWSRGDEVSTDDLRMGLQRYRSFFERLLEV